LLRPAWSWFIAFPVTFGGACAFLRDEILPPATADSYKLRKLLNMLPNWPASAWIALALASVLVCFFEASFKHAEALERKLALADGAHGAAENTNHQAISIDFEPIQPFLRRTVLPTGNARFECYIRIKNIGNGFLSECVVSITSIVPQPRPDRSAHTVLTPISSLSKGEHKFVLVAGFNEARVSPHQEIYNELVTFAFASGGVFPGFTTIKPPAEDNPSIITVEVCALECKTETRRFKIWVGEGRKLLMAPV
jgi:hypothetical protein